jgi:hypothetical protein
MLACAPGKLERLVGALGLHRFAIVKRKARKLPGQVVRESCLYRRCRQKMQPRPSDRGKLVIERVANQRVTDAVGVGIAQLFDDVPLTRLLDRGYACLLGEVVRHAAQHRKLELAQTLGLELLAHPGEELLNLFGVSLPSPRRRTDAARQCASTVCSAASFHGLIFASVFARLVFATSVS